jgi:uncharacterized protein YbjT (DUF2867 family)
VGRKHAAAEQLVKDSGADWAVLRPTFFMDNFVNYAGEGIRTQGSIYGASKGQPVSYISSRDIAEVAASILLDPAPHSAKTYELTGPAAMRDEEVAERLAESLGREVRYVDLTPEQITEAAKSQGAPVWMAEAFGGLEQIKGQGWAAGVSPAVSQILGHEGERFESFLTRNRARLAG